jgi:hypothetical protein
VLAVERTPKFPVVGHNGQSCKVAKRVRVLTIPIVLPSASESFDIVQILLEQTATLWSDFVVTGLSTATKAALQIWYRT